MKAAKAFLKAAAVVAAGAAMFSLVVMFGKKYDVPFVQDIGNGFSGNGWFS